MFGVGHGGLLHRIGVSLGPSIIPTPSHARRRISNTALAKPSVAVVRASGACGTRGGRRSGREWGDCRASRGLASARPACELKPTPPVHRRSRLRNKPKCACTAEVP